MMTTMQSLTTDMLDDLADNRAEYLTAVHPEDMLHESIDGWVPIYNGELIEVLESDGSLATGGSDLYGPDADIYQRLQAAIYEELSQHAYSWLSELEYETDDCELADDGTMDTVILVCGEEHRYDCETAADYRDDDGTLDFDLFIEEIVLPDLN